MGALDLSFLSDGGDVNGMEKLKDHERYSIPTAESFQRPIADDDFEIGMARTDEEKRSATDARASKLWRTLRIASKSKLNLFDKIDDGNNLKALFEIDQDERKKSDLNGLDENADHPAKGIDESESIDPPVEVVEPAEKEQTLPAERGAKANGGEATNEVAAI